MPAVFAGKLLAELVAATTNKSVPGYVCVLFVLIMIGSLVLIVGGIAWLRYNKHKFDVKRPPPLDVSQLTDVITICKNCGAYNNIKATNCRQCGAPLGAAAASPDEPKQAAGRTPVAHGVLKDDVAIEGQVAFKKGEVVDIELVSADPARPEYQYVVRSRSLDKQYRLSENELVVLRPSERKG